MATYDQILNEFGLTGQDGLIPCGPIVTPGAGYDSITNDLKGGSAWTQIKESDSKSGHESWYDIEVVTDETSLREVLSISASASFSYGAYSGNAAYNSYHETDTTTYDLYLLVRCRVFNGVKRYAVSKYSPEARKIWGVGGPQQREAFNGSYGDHFVGAIVTGGEFVVVLRIAATSVTDQQSVKTALSAAGVLGGGVSLNVDALRVFTSNHTTLKVTRHNVGGVVSVQSETVDALLKAAHDFPSTVQGDDVKDYAFVATNYRDIPDSEFVVNCAAPNALRLIEQLATVYGRQQQRLASWKFARRNFVLFPPKEDADYQQTVYDWEDALARTQQIAQDVAGGRFGTLTNIKIPTLDQPPKLVRPPDVVTGVVNLQIETSWRVGEMGLPPDAVKSPSIAGANTWCGIVHRDTNIPVITGPAHTMGIVTFCLSNVPLPPDHSLQYRCHLSGEGLGDTPRPPAAAWMQGTTSTPAAWIEAIYVWIVGLEAARYKVSYETSATDGTPGSGSNGSVGGSTGQTLRLNAVKVAVTVL